MADSSDFIKDRKMALSTNSFHENFMVDDNFELKNRCFTRKMVIQMKSKTIAEL
jgi:hypothetical protein